MRSHLSPALVISCIALAVALSGTGYAAFALPPNSVGTSQLKANAVTHAKLAANAVTGSDVRDGSLRSADFKSGQIPRGPSGAQGPQGLQGAKGDKGDKGDTGPSQTFYNAIGGGVSLPTDADTPVASLALTAGSYVLIGRAALQDNSGVAHVVRCKFSPSDTLADGILNLGVSDESSLGISDPVTLSASATVVLSCHNYGGATTAYTRVIEAIRVGALAQS